MAADTRRPTGTERSMPPAARAMGPVNRGVARDWEATAEPAMRAMASAQLRPPTYQNGPVRPSSLRPRPS